MLILWPSRKAKERTPKEKVKIVGVKEKVKARKEKAKEEKTKVKDLGTKTTTAKVGTLTNGIRTLGASNGTTAKAKERTKEVSPNKETRVAAVETSEAEGSSPQPEPEITARFALEEEMAERPHRSRSARTSGGQILEGDESEKSLMNRLEKIQHQMNRSAIHGRDVDQELVDAQQAIYASLKALRTKALEQEAMERRAASAPAPARDSRLQQDIDSGMHPRAARKADKGRQRAADHQRRLAEEKASKGEQPAKSRSKRPSPRRESRPEGRHPSPRRHRSGKERSDRKRRQMQEEEDKLTVEEEEALISAQLEEVHESPAVKEQIARVLREAYRERFGADPEPGSSKRPSMSHKDPVDELDDLPSSELDELEEKFGQSIDITSEGQARLKGSERQEKERREKAKPDTEMIGKVSREEYERQRAVTKEIEREKRKALEQEERERLGREKRDAKAVKETNPKKEDEKLRSAPSKVRPNPPEDVPHWINASDGSLKSFREIHRLSQWQQGGKGEIYVSCLRCHKTIKGLEPYSLWAHVESKG